MTDHPPAPAQRHDLAAPGVPLPPAPREAALFLRYLQALALLCECRPYLDEPDYADLIDRVLEDAASHYPVEIERDGERRGILPRRAAGG